MKTIYKLSAKNYLDFTQIEITKIVLLLFLLTCNFTVAIEVLEIRKPTIREVSWNGSISNDWFDSRNWNGGIPTENTNVVISRGIVLMPVIDPTNSSFAVQYNNTASVSDLTITEYATLVMKDYSVLYVSGNWYNSGEFYPNASTVVFNGKTFGLIQTINQGSKIKERFFNLILNSSNGAKGILIDNEFQLTVANNFILLNGDLRLAGNSQLIQKGENANQNYGFGNILIDQKGQSSSYNYNFWSSPVTHNGFNYSVGSILRDGTNSADNPFNPLIINFNNNVYHADGNLTSPIRLSTAWMFKHSNLNPVQSQWINIGSTGLLNPSEGFTMKGVTGTTISNNEQNYVFVGKPNNGNYSINLPINHNYLVGNPYPCALDADEFIKDNIKYGFGRAHTNVFNGALYFWNHTNSHSHGLFENIGSYACYTLMGGNSSNLGQNSNNHIIKTPKRFIPVGQGFIIRSIPINSIPYSNSNSSTNVTGGTIQFKNSQRVFVTETSNNSIFIRNATLDTEIDHRPRIRLSIGNSTAYRRQVMVGADSNATNAFDVGYDALSIDDLSDDIYWDLNTEKLIIQAVPDFNNGLILPLIIKTSTNGIITLKIETIENVPESTVVLLADNLTGNTHYLKENPLSIFLPAGIYANRFSVRFLSSPLSQSENNSNNNIIAYFESNSGNLIIKNNFINPIKNLSIFNLNGQKLLDFDTISYQDNLVVDCSNFSKTTYIIKITSADQSKKNTKIILR